MSKKTIDINDEFNLTFFEKFLVYETSTVSPLRIKSVFRSKTEANILKIHFFIGLICWGLFFGVPLYNHFCPNTLQPFPTELYPVLLFLLPCIFFNRAIRAKRIRNNAVKVRDDIIEHCDHYISTKETDTRIKNLKTIYNQNFYGSIILAILFVVLLVSPHIFPPEAIQ